jgi:tetratricopeptide (TPR) repeat protein
MNHHNDPQVKVLRLASALMGLGFLIVLTGCGKDVAEPSVEELVRRSKQSQKSTTNAADNSVDAQLTSIEQKIVAGNIGGAQLELRPLLIANPNHPAINLLHARVLAAENRIAEALQAADAIDGSDNKDNKTLAAALWLTVDWALEIDDYESARDRLNRLMQVQGPSNRLHRRSAEILNTMGLRFDAAKHLKALADKGDISEKELFAMNTYGDPFIDESIRKPILGDRPKLAWLSLARRYRADGDLTRARELSDQLATSFPQSTAIAAFRGRIYNDLNDEIGLSSWMSLLPNGIENEPEYWAVMGTWAQRLGLHRAAVRYLCEAVSLDATDRFSYLSLARSLNAVGETVSAKVANERFILLDEIAQIIQKIGSIPGTAEDLDQMADRLGALGRNSEATAWRAIARKSRSSAVTSQSQSSPPTASLSSLDDASAFFQTCGIDPSDWPLPSREELGQAVPTTMNRGRAGESAGKIEMQDVASEIGVSFTYDNGDDSSDDSRLLHQMTGGGIGVIDYDLDGWPDLYLSQAGGDAFNASASKPNQMFRNLSAELFTNTTQNANVGDLGYGQGIAVADINQDGFPDILVANIGPNVMYINNGDGTFNRQVIPYIGSGAWTTSIACGDLDGDGLPDVVEVNYVDDPTAMTIACTPERDVCNPSVFRPASDRMLRSTGQGDLEEWPGGVRIHEKPNYGFGAIITNFDDRFGNDVFIANDTGYNHLWISDPVPSGLQTGDTETKYRLNEIATILGCAAGALGERQGCMGIASGDFDRNGHIDLHVTNFWDQPADLYLQQPKGIFINGNRSHGIHDTSRRTVGWGTQATDLDRDGWLDLVVLNGHLTDHRSRGVPLEMKPQLFKGSSNGFSLVPAESIRPASQSPGDDKGFWDRPALGRTLAVVDWNVDGKPDMAANSLDSPLSILVNRSLGGNFLRIQLVGVSSERDAVGAKVVLRSGDEAWTAWSIGGGGFLAANERVLDFGIGQCNTVDAIEIDWPSGATQRIENLKINQTLLVIEGDASPHPRP